MKWKAGLKKWQENRGKLKREIEANAFAELLVPEDDVQEVVDLLDKQAKRKRDKQRDRIIRYTKYNTYRSD